MLDIEAIFNPDQEPDPPRPPTGFDLTPTDLPADWYFDWDERAAIMEYDGKMPKERAEAEALKDILRQMHSAGITVPPVARSSRWG